MTFRVPTTGANPSYHLLQSNPIRFVREVLVQFLQGLFHHQVPGNYHWEQGEETEIFIMSEGPVKTSLVGTRPALMLTRAPIRLQTLGLDDMATYDANTGAKTKTVVIPGTLVINACSRAPLESESLAWHAGEHIWLLRDILHKTGFYQIGQDIGIGSPSPAGTIVAGDGADEWYVTHVTLPFHLQRTSRVTPLGQTIAKSIETRVRGLFEEQPKQELERYSLEDGVTVSSSSPAGTPNYGPASLDRPGAYVDQKIERVDGVRPPRLKGRQLPITGVIVPESLQHGLNGPPKKV